MERGTCRTLLSREEDCEGGSGVGLERTRNTAQKLKGHFGGERGNGG